MIRVTLATYQAAGKCLEQAAIALVELEDDLEHEGLDVIACQRAYALLKLAEEALAEVPPLAYHGD
jgi:hypothetical protein